MTSYELFGLVFYSSYYPIITMPDQSNTITPHTINVFFALHIPQNTAFALSDIYRKSLIDIPGKGLFFRNKTHFIITVQLLCDSADNKGFFTEPDAIIVFFTPSVNASVLANTFFSIPGPILGNNFLASSKVRQFINLSSIIKPLTFVIKTTISDSNAPATLAAALSPSIFKNS